MDNFSQKTPITTRNIVSLEPTNKSSRPTPPNFFCFQNPHWTRIIQGAYLRFLFSGAYSFMQSASMHQYVYKLHAGLIKVSTLFPWGRERISDCILSTLTCMLLLCRPDYVAGFSQPQRQPPSRKIMSCIEGDLARCRPIQNTIIA